MNRMRVLKLHSRYRMDSGENIAFDREVDLLRRYDHDVLPLQRQAVMSSAAEMAMETLGISLDPAAELEYALAAFHPDIIHIDALFPRWGPCALAVLRTCGVRVVQTVHNYRHWCVAGTGYRDGAMCNQCMGKPFAWPGITYGCYRGSKAQSAVLAAGLARANWNHVHFMAVSRFVAETLAEAGIAPLNRVSTRYNWTEDRGIGDGAGGYALFCGDPLGTRPEKGWAMLASAWAFSGLSDRDLVPAHGVPHEEVIEMMGRAAFLVVPSLWHEPCPLVVIEALSRGTPVLSTDLGGLPELIEDGVNGWLVPPTAETMADGLKRAFAEADSLRLEARASYEKRFTPRHGHDGLMDVYRHAFAARSEEQVLEYANNG
jgi:glycosyltransferase involved in cell wall biosynthesis